MSDDETITVTKAAWNEVLQRLAALEAGTPDLVPSPIQRPAAVTVTPRSADAVELPLPPSIGRRRALLGLAGAAAAGVVGAAAAVSPAAAADGDTLKAGQQVVPTLSTSLRYTAEDRAYGFGVIDTTQPSYLPQGGALYGHADNKAFNYGVQARGTGSATALGAYADQRAISAIGNGASPVVEIGTGNSTGVTLQLSGPGHHIRFLDGAATPPPERPQQTFPGTMTKSSDNDLWYSTGNANSPGWRKLAGPATAGSLHVLPAPRRVYDSRAGSTPAVGTKKPLAAGTTRVIDLKANYSGVPAGASAAVLTILLVNAASGSGNVTVWANYVAKPASNTMVWGGTAGRFTATALTALSSLAEVQINTSATTDVVIDVVGYYR